MPSFETFKKINGGRTIGQNHKAESDMIMEATWEHDIGQRVAYFYDYYHDDYPTQLNDLHPEKDKNKIPISIKYLANSSQTLSKDAVSYHLQLRPSQDEDVVPYYKEVFEKRYNATFPLGLYVDIPDNKGRYNRWMVVAKADYDDAQFSTYELLRCDYVFQWIVDGVKMQMAGVTRSQNSYNSGVWLDYRIESPENQQMCILPMNRDTEKLFYNLRMIIDNNVLTEPVAWVVTKVNRIANNGLVKLTFAQDLYDPHRDYMEVDPDGNVIGKWADYYTDGIAAEDVDDTQDIVVKVSVVGKPKIKVNGGSKRLFVNFYRDEEERPYMKGIWSFTIDGHDASTLVEVSTEDLKENEIALRFVGTDEFIGDILTCTFTASDTLASDSVQLSIAGL